MWSPLASETQSSAGDPLGTGARWPKACPTGIPDARMPAALAPKVYSALPSSEPMRLLSPQSSGWRSLFQNWNQRPWEMAPGRTDWSASAAIRCLAPELHTP